MAVREAGVVVVGVDDTPEAREAARYAAQLAHLRGLDLLVAHAYHLLAVPPMGQDVIDSMRDSAQGVLDRALADLEPPSGLRVESVLGIGSAVLMLRDLAQRAQLVVLGHHHVELKERLMLGAITAPVAATAPCPVVVVPAGWSQPDSTGRPVVVALDGETPASAALDYAISEAELRGCPLLALHAAPPGEPPTDGAEEEASIVEILAGCKQDHPDTVVTTRLVPGDASDVIVDVSERAAVLVVGRPHAGQFGSWTWSVARAVLDNVSCPLVIVSRRAADRPLDLRGRQRAVLTSEP